jgi:macrodomain Ter protein organizer (MatP/YcbG family)
MAGKQITEIKEETGYADSTIYGILKDDRVVQVRQQLLKGLDDELEVLYKDAIQAVRTALKAEDIDTQLKGADMFFKVQGKYKEKGGNTTINISAEDVALQLINQARETPSGG